MRNKNSQLPGATGVAVQQVVRLTPAQQELYTAMLNGCTCHYMPYAERFNPSAYYFRTDNMKRCTAQATALLKRGLVEKYKEDWRGHKLRAIQPNAAMSDCAGGKLKS